MSFQAVANALRVTGISPTEKLVLICIANYADENNQAWPSQSRISEETGMARQSINRILARLEKIGILSRKEQHRENGSRTSSVITLHPLSPKVTPPVTESDTPCHPVRQAPVTESDTQNLSDITYQDKVVDVGAPAGVSTDHLGWPTDWRDWSTRLCAAIGYGPDPRKHLFLIERRSIDAYRAWRQASIHWDTVVAVIIELLAKKRDGPPSMMGYFTKAIAQAHADRTAGIIIPQARDQTNERRNHHPTAAERHQDSTVAAFRNVFGGVAAGQDESGHAARSA